MTLVLHEDSALNILHDVEFGSNDALIFAIVDRSWDWEILSPKSMLNLVFSVNCMSSSQ
jgi:hypothetical protein